MKVLVIDDQVNVVEGILQEVDWQRAGVREVYKAYGASEAKSILLTQKIDIMLCDIEMPGENGLMLLQWVRDKKMETECIFLTSHADFQYAKTAVRLGSFDYILQPARYIDIENAIVRVIQKIRGKREQEKYSEYGRSFWEEQKKFQDHVMWEWYREPEKMSCEEVKSVLQKLGRELYDTTQITLILCDVLKWWDKPWEMELFRYSCRNILEELLQWRAEVFCFGLAEEKWMMMIKEAGTSLSGKELRKAAGEFRTHAEHFFACDMALYIGDRAPFSEANFRLMELKRLQRDNVALQPGIFIEGEERENAPVSLPDYRTWEKLLVQGMGEAVYEEACAYLQELIKRRQLDESRLQRFYNEFYHVLCKVEEQTNTSYEDIFYQPGQIESALHAYENINTMMDFVKIVAGFFSELPEDGVKVRKQIEQIKEYIYRNLEKDIRREDIAAEVYLNPNYVSRLFKRETGMSLKEFIVQEKMKMAQALLKGSHLPVSIIALKVGYNNFSHFSQVYRKTYGISPTEERKG